MPEELMFDGTTWDQRIAFSPMGGGFFYVPDRAIVRDSVADADLGAVRAEGELFETVDEPSGGFRRVSGSFDAVRVVAQLRSEGVDAQPEHVFFAHNAHGCDCCCGPHPADRLAGAPAHANPFSANPFYANPFYANPFYANPFSANPFSANPFSANPFYANPFYANASGPTRSSARPADAPAWFVRASNRPASETGRVHSPRVVVLDSGLAIGRNLPSMLAAGGIAASSIGQHGDVPDANGDRWLDPIAGHGTFIAGIIERIAPGCEVDVQKVLGPQGDGTESAVVAAIDFVANADDPPAFLNLSFGGYVWERAPMLSAAILRAQRRGIVVVASAGNDGTCRPTLPAAIPGVVSVGALGPNGPARFSNYGDWVRASAPGVDVVSAFFAAFDGPALPVDGHDIDEFRAWARWSGTSFAAPAVVGALVREMRRAHCSAAEAVASVIDAPWLARLPGLGTIVNV
jgi:hypothetical protein